jgi:hypothetical protein
MSKPKNWDVREDGKVFDGRTWRKPGKNHHMNSSGLIFYKRKYRTLESYLQQGGNLDRIVLENTSVNAINDLVTKLYHQEKSGDVYAITHPLRKGWVKVGKAMLAENRLGSYQTGDPFREYKLLCKLFVEDNATAEKELHDLFEAEASERRLEWFKISQKKTKELFDEFGNRSQRMATSEIQRHAA